MKLPNAEAAVIDVSKLHGYLLSRTHPSGRFKAVFFEALGYTAAGWKRLETDLRTQHLSADALPGQASPYGQKFEITATLTGPAGRSAVVISVWVVLKGEDVPRFVTAFPGDQR